MFELNRARATDKRNALPLPMADNATLRDVVLVVSDDEAHHRDVDHRFANTLAGRPQDIAPVAAYPKHATELSVGV